MFMTANRIKIEGKPVLKLNMHEYADTDIAFLDSLGIDKVEEEYPNCRYTYIYSKEDFLTTRATISEHYDILEEKGIKVFLAAK